jgi:hypothetical protein
MKTAIIGLAFLGALVLPAMADCTGRTLTNEQTDFTAAGWTFELLPDADAQKVVKVLQPPAGTTQVAYAEKADQPNVVFGFFDVAGCETGAVSGTPEQLAKLFHDAQDPKPIPQNGHVGKFDFDSKRNEI